MAKKTTTGGPRARRLTAADVERRREYRSRAERERLWQRRILMIFGALVAFMVIVLAYGLITEQIVRPGQAILTINDDKVTTSDFADRVRLTRWQTAQQIRELYMLVGGDTQMLSQYAGEQISQLRSPALMGGAVLDDMQQDLLIEQYAEEHDITVDEAAIDKAVDEYMAGSFGLTLPDAETPTPTTEPSVTPTPLVSPTPSSTPTVTPTLTPTATVTPVEGEATATAGPTLTPTIEPTVTLTPTPTATLEPQQISATLEEAADTYYEDAEDDADADRETVRKLFYYQALRQAVYEDLTKDQPLEELQVNARHILISFSPDVPEGQTAPPPTDEEKAAALARAEEVMAALQSGEPFADLAKEVSDDNGTSQQPGGSAAQGGELGWSSPEGYVDAFKDTVLSANIGEIVGPIETEFGYHIIQVMDREVRPLTESDLNQRKGQTWQEWLDAATAAADIERREDWVDRVPEDPTFEDLLGDILQ